MAPRQLRLEPVEVDMGADKGVKRVRVDSTEESSKNPCVVFSRGACPPMGGTAHQPSRPPMAARFQALPSTHLSDTQQQSGTSNPGRPARAVSHPTLNLRKALETGAAQNGAIPRLSIFVGSGFLGGRGLLEIDVLVRPSPMPRAEHCEGGRGKGGERVPSAVCSLSVSHELFARGFV
eukprot:scaffold11824_cov125-Isochrysis_galbana.AAC.5